jgi:hypothetical protein
VNLAMHGSVRLIEGHWRIRGDFGVLRRNFRAPRACL